MFLLLLLVCVGARRSRDVETTQGAVRGYYHPGPPHFAYLGLPYARAPTQWRRFKAPEPPPRWDGLFEATYKVRCPIDGAGDENCLVVNVFTAEGLTNQPVLVIVQDATDTGVAPHETPTRFLNENLLVVTFNYRVGALGFLCLGIPEAPGNAGLKDQVAALYWVQRNIAKFGGNPHDVTVYGIGAGAVMVQMLLLSDMAEGLAHKVILESGSLLSPMSLTYDAISTAFLTASQLGYNGSTANINELVRFYKRVPVRKLSSFTEMFLPCIGSDIRDLSSIAHEDPIAKLEKGDFFIVPMIIMFKMNDGRDVVEKNKDNFRTIAESFEHLLPSNLQFDNNISKFRIAELVKEFYFDTNEYDIEGHYKNYFHHVLYEYPILKFAVLYAEKSDKPVYVLKSLFKGSDVSIIKEKKHNRNLIEYMYDYNNVEEDELVIRRLIILLTNFIKIGDPTPITTWLINLIWQPVAGESVGHIKLKEAYTLLLDSSLSMMMGHHNQHLRFWDQIYKNFYKIHTHPIEDIE